MSHFTALLLVFGLGLVNCRPHDFASFPYTKIADHLDGVEEREYESVTMPSYTTIPCIPWNSAQSQGYFHLSMYSRYGANVNGAKLRMGVPVILGIHNVPDVEDRCAQVYTSYFYISDTDIPAANNTAIVMDTLPANKFYVMSTSNIVRNPNDLVLALRVKLNTQGLCYNADRPQIAFFSSPSSFKSSRAEVWLPVVPCPHN